MKQTDIERIIKQGSVKQKIKLYFTDVAYFNITGINNANIEGSHLKTKDQVLTDKERDLIFNSVKDPKDIKYWGELRTWNRAFLMFKPTISNHRYNFKYLTAQLSKYVVINLLHKNYEEAINDILDVVEDKKLREIMVKKALESLEVVKAKRYQEKGFLPFIEIRETNTETNTRELVELINEKIKEAKEFIEAIKQFLNKQLPLQPYKQFVKEEEEMIKAELKECRELIESFFLLPEGLQPDQDKDFIEIAEKLNLPDILRYKIDLWEDIEVEITEEDIEDIKNAGI